MPKPRTASHHAHLEAQVAQLTQHMATRHMGAACGVSALGLAAALGITPRQLRHVVTAAREQGLALCGHPRTGYYIAQTADELRSAASFLEQRAFHSLRLLARMRQVSLPELMGQLQLPT